MIRSAVAARRPNTTTLLEVRSLKPEDLELLRHKTAPVQLRSLRDRHHHIAWLIALGKPNTEIAVECRLSPERVSVLKNSPALQELIARYRKEIEDARLEAVREFGAVAARNMTIAEGLISQKLEAAQADPTTAPTLRELNTIATDRMDRFGYPKKTLSDNRNVNLNYAAKLEEAIARSRSNT